MKREKGIRIILAILGIILVGTGVAFNAAAALGNDPVGIVYDWNQKRFKSFFRTAWNGI